MLTNSGTATWSLIYGNPWNPLPDPEDGSWITPSGEVQGATANTHQSVVVVPNERDLDAHGTSDLALISPPVQLTPTIGVVAAHDFGDLAEGVFELFSKGSVLSLEN